VREDPPDLPFVNSPMGETDIMRILKRCMVAAALLGSSCADDRSAGEESDIGYSPEVPCSEDWTQLASSGFSPESGTAPPLRLQREMCIDGVRHDLLPIDDLAVRPDGVIAVLQRQGGGIRFFAPDGEFLGLVGSLGDGAGEFRNPSRIGLAADSVVVYDPRLARVSIIGPNLTIERTVMMPRVGHREAPGRARSAHRVLAALRLPGDEFLATIFASPDDQADDLLDGGSSILARLSPERLITDVVARLPRDDEGIEVRGSGGVVYVQLPFPNPPHLGWSPDGSRVAVVVPRIAGNDEGTIELTMLSIAGDTVFHRRTAFEPVRIRRQVADSARAAYLIRAREATIAERAEAYRAAAEHVPPVYPPVRDLLVGVDGSLWLVGRVVGGARVYRVFDPRGEEVGRLRLPRNVWIPAATLDHLWTVELEALGVGSIARYRLAH
jgi:hypothetical protein